MILCDSCGRPADTNHIRERIERLELATRFRPVHIRVLLIDAAPPLRHEDYFYRVAKGQSARSEVSRAYFARLVNCVAAPRNPGIAMEDEAALAEFQRDGLFLTCAVECPIENSSELSAALKQAMPNLLKRVQLSYKPKYIALLSRNLDELLPGLRSAWGDRLILDGASAFAGAESKSSEAGAGQLPNPPDRLAEAIKRLS